MAKGRFVPDEDEQPTEIRTGFTPIRPTMPLPAAETDRERRDESFDPTTKETPNPQYGDPSGDTARESRPQTDRDTQEGFFPEVHSSGITGHFDAWVGEVMQTYYDTGHSSGSDFGTISVRRSDVDWGTNNAPAGFEVNATLSQRTPGIVDAKQFPLRHDQQKYIVAVGDFVIVLTGRDDRHWYMVDEEPFMGVVIDNTEEGGGAEVKEDFCGGAGNVSLCVSRRVLTGDPDGAGWTGPVHTSNMQTSGSVDIAYQGVVPVGPTNVQHGYRVGDEVWVNKKGRYLFCTFARQGFFAVLHTSGPAGEGEPADEGYYVKEIDWTITYSNETATYSVNTAVRTAAVGGESGTNGRWVLAINRALRDSAHSLAVDGTVFVWVNIIRDPVSGEAGYTFYYEPAPAAASNVAQWGTAYEIWTDDATATGNGSYVMVHPSDRDGGNEDAGTNHKVWLPRYGKREDPNVQDDDVISYVEEEGGNFVASSGLLDGKKFETIRIHTDAANIPPGWSIADGSSPSTHDLSASFLVGFKAADPNFGAVGNTGGGLTHSHANHDDHNESNAWDDVFNGLIGGANIPQSVPVWDYTTDPIVITHSAHSSANHLPPYYTVVWIERTS